MVSLAIYMKVGGVYDATRLGWESILGSQIKSSTAPCSHPIASSALVGLWTGIRLTDPLPQKSPTLEKMPVEPLRLAPSTIAKLG